MSIEEDILQRQFESEYHRLHVNILFTASWLNGKLSEALHEYDLSPEQFNVLRILKGANKQVNLKYISERLVNKQSNTSRLIDKLFSKKMVERKTSKEDRRNVEISISAFGSTVVNQASDSVKKLEVQLNGIKAKEAKEVSDALDRFRKSN